MSDSKKLSPLSERITSNFILIKLIDEIMAKWETYVRREVGSAMEMLPQSLRNQLPNFLKLLGGALAESHSRGMLEDGSEIIKTHAGDRARRTSFNPTEIVQELKALRQIVISSLEEKTKLSEQDYTTIQKTFDQAIQESLMEFFLAHAELREQFTATLSHDLRNPLATAKLGAELIERLASKIENPKEHADILQLTSKIVTSMKRADKMIQDLLDASVLQLGEKLPIQISQCDLLRIVNEVVATLDAVEQDRIKVSGALTFGYWDCEGLRRAFENLIGNAIKYGDPNSEITVKIEREKECVKVAVHNFGVPVSDKNQDLIFRPFGRTESAKTHKGWGLGLSIVRAIAEALGGSAEIKSNQNEGTTFTIILPNDSREFVRARGF